MMKIFAKVDSDGVISRVWEQDEDARLPVTDGYTYEVLTALFDVQAAPTITSVPKLVDGAGAWIETATLDEAKSLAWGRVKAARDLAEASDFTCAGLVYQADKARISGAALAALMAQVGGAAYSIDWTLSDNSVTTLNAAQMSAVGVALMEHVDAAFSIARGLRVAIEAATTIAEAAAVAWP